MGCENEAQFPPPGTEFKSMLPAHSCHQAVGVLKWAWPLSLPWVDHVCLFITDAGMTSLPAFLCTVLPWKLVQQKKKICLVRNKNNCCFPSSLENSLLHLAKCPPTLFSLLSGHRLFSESARLIPQTEPNSLLKS